MTENKRHRAMIFELANALGVTIDQQNEVIVPTGESANLSMSDDTLDVTLLNDKSASVQINDRLGVRSLVQVQRANPTEGHPRDAKYVITYTIGETASTIYILNDGSNISY